MAGIVEGLFGLSPAETALQRQNSFDQAALTHAKLDPFQRASMGMYQAGGGLGRMAGGMLGMEDPIVAQAKFREQALTGLDPSNPQAILERAAQIQDPRLKMQLTMLARQQMAEQQKMAADAARMAREEAMARAAENRSLRELLVAERGEPAMKYMPEVAKLIALRDSMPENDPRREYLDAAIRKATFIQEPKSLEEIEASKIRLLEEKERIKTQAAEDKAKESDVKSYQWLSKKFGEIENAMADSLGVAPDALQKALTTGKGSSEEKLDRAVGWIDKMIPAMSQEKTTILSHINRLKNLGQTGGLADLRAAGVAPGSITEREWPKFQADLANIDESLDAPSLLKQYLRIFQKIQDAKVRGEELQGSSAGKWEASTPEEVRALMRKGTITRDQAKTILKDMGF